MEDSETKGRIKQETEKACVSVERIGSTLLSSFAKKGKEASSKRSYKRKTEEQICSKSNNKKTSQDEEDGKNIRKRKSKRQQKVDKVELDGALRLQRRTRYLLIKMKMQQNLIDAYATEGWKGQSREKIRPDKELERARKQILNCKLGLREAIHQLDLLSSVGSIEEEVMAPDGSIHHEHIFCAKCNSREAFPDNDIILCDGTCNRAFHQKCLDPPLETESIPPGDQGWFCEICVCKMEIIDTVNAQIGTQFPVDSNWQDIFKEEANLPIGSEATLNNEADWPSDDSKDDDYDPEMKETGRGSNSDVSDDDGESISTSLSLSSDGVALSTGSWEGHRFSNMVELCETSNEETVCGPRQRRTVDYTKLYYEMFGKDAGLQEQGSEDEDWGPSERRKRRKESDAASTLVTMCENSKKDEEAVEIPERGEKDSISVEDKGGQRTMFRLPRGAVEKLRQVFAENELPSKAVRDSLSKELSLEPEKVSKWFKNARYMALRNRKTESVKQPEDSKAASGDSAAEVVMENNNKETNEIQDTAVETVSLGLNYSITDQKQISPCNNQVETQQASVSFPTPQEDESQQYLQQKDTSFNHLPHEEINSEMSLKTDLKEKEETESKVMEEEEFEALMEKEETESKVMEEEEFEAVMEKEETESKMMEEEEFEALMEEETESKMMEEEEFKASEEEEEEEEETERKMTEEEEFEAVMEKLCRTENKLLDVTQRLERFRTPKGRKKLGKSSSSVLEQDSSVVYVPTAEIKEKR